MGESNNTLFYVRQASRQTGRHVDRINPCSTTKRQQQLNDNNDIYHCSLSLCLMTAMMIT